MSKDTKAPLAFPYSGVGDDLNYSKGMTLRDYFAAKALQALVSLPEANGTADYFAAGAYQYADAMIKARSAS